MSEDNTVGILAFGAYLPRLRLSRKAVADANAWFNPALKAHQKAVELNPESPAAHASVGETLLFLRKPKDALTELDRAVELDPEGSAGQFAKALKEAHELGIFG